MEECMCYKQEFEASIPPCPNDIAILIFLIKIYFIMIYYGYEGGSKLTSYVTMSGVQNFPCMLQRGGLKTPPVILYEEGSLPPPKVCKEFLGGFWIGSVGTYEGCL